MKISDNSFSNLFVKTFQKNMQIERKIQHLSLKQDEYIPECIYIYEIYGKNFGAAIPFSQLFLDAINFHDSGVTETDTSFIFAGIEINKSDIPPVNSQRCSEIKATDNKIVFKNGEYYSFIGSEQKNHVLICQNNTLQQPFSELAAGRQSDESAEIDWFWNLMSYHGTDLYFSREYQRKKLNDVGITKGFFSVEVGNDKAEWFYSNGEAGPVISKKVYDNQYKLWITDGGLGKGYETGTVFKIGSDEYVLGEDGKLDIPYGADIYNIEYPNS